MLIRNLHFKDARDNIAYMVAFVVAVIAMWNGESIPTLWMATGCQKLTRLLRYLLSEVSRASGGVKTSAIPVYKQ